MQGYTGSCFCELEELFNQKLSEQHQFLLDIVAVEQMVNVCDTKNMGGDIYYRCAAVFPAMPSLLLLDFYFVCCKSRSLKNTEFSSRDKCR